MKNLSLLLAFIFAIVASESCKKSDQQKQEDQIGASKMVSDLKGFEYIGSFEEQDAPTYYEYPLCYHIDNYLDNDRILVTSQKTIINPPMLYKYYILNYKGGKLTSSHSTKDGFGDDRGNKFQFVFDHPTFKLKSWHNVGHYYWELDPEGKEKVYIVSAGNQFNAKYINNYLLRFISEIKIWPYNTSTEMEEAQYLLTGELSAMKVIDYFFDDNYDIEKGNSIYTGYFYPTLTEKWIGVAKGNQRLDSLLISSSLDRTFDLSICRTFIEKIGSKIYLAFIKNTPNMITQDLSFYELNLGENILKPISVDLPLPANENIEIAAFKNGKLYFFPTANSTDKNPYTISTLGKKEAFNMPNYTGASVIRREFGKKYLYLVLSDGPKRIEFYKYDLYK